MFIYTITAKLVFVYQYRNRYFWQEEDKKILWKVLVWAKQISIAWFLAKLSTFLTASFYQHKTTSEKRQSRPNSVFFL